MKKYAKWMAYSVLALVAIPLGLSLCFLFWLDGNGPSTIQSIPDYVFVRMNPEEQRGLTAGFGIYQIPVDPKRLGPYPKYAFYVSKEGRFIFQYSIDGNGSEFYRFPD